MPVGYTDTFDDATLASHSSDTQLTIKLPCPLLSLQLASKNLEWIRMTQDKYEEMLKDPEQEESVNRAIWMVGFELRASSKWRALRDPDFATKLRTMLENADGDPITQINLRLAGGEDGYARLSQDKFEEMKSQGGPAWDRMVQRFNKVLEERGIKVKPSRVQKSAFEASSQGSADGISVSGSEFSQATTACAKSAQNTNDISNASQRTSRAPDDQASDSVTADSAVTATGKFVCPKQ